MGIYNEYNESKLFVHKIGMGICNENNEGRLFVHKI